MDDNFEDLINSDNVSVHSGFPNPASDSHRSAVALDLNHLLVRRPESTYLFKISGHNWSDQGIYDGDIAIVDRSALEKANDLVVVWQEDNFRLIRRHYLNPGQDGWGVVSSVIHKF